MKSLKIIPITAILCGILTTYVCAASDMTNIIHSNTTGGTFSNTSGTDITNILPSSNTAGNTTSNTSGSDITNILPSGNTTGNATGNTSGSDITNILPSNTTMTNNIGTANNTTGEEGIGGLTPTIKKDYVQEYLSSIAVEKDSIANFLEKIDSKKLLDAMCEGDSYSATNLRNQKDKINKIGIRLYNKNNRNEELAQITFDLLSNEKNIIKSSNNNICTGIVICGDVWLNNGSSGVSDITGSELGFVLKGDLTGKGDIGVVDLSLMQQQLVDEISLENEYLNAADMDTNYEIDVIDMSMLQDYITKN